MKVELIAFKNLLLVLLGTWNVSFITESKCSSATQTISRTLKRKKLQKWNGSNIICTQVFIDKRDKLRVGSQKKKEKLI